jgi:hypothetical protein
VAGPNLVRKLHNGFNVAWRQTRSICPTDAGVGRAAREEKCTTKNQLTHRSNENKMSDDWRESASLRIAGEISSKVRNQSCQSFAPSPG